MKPKSILFTLSLALGSAGVAEARTLGASNCWETGEAGPTILYQIDERLGTYAPIGEIDICDITGLAKRHRGSMYAVNAGTPFEPPATPMEPHLIRIVPDPSDPDRLTGEIVGPIGIENDPEVSHSIISDIAYSENDELYAIEYFITRIDGERRAGNALWRLNPDTGRAEHRIIQDFESRFLSIDFSHDSGALYGWDVHRGLVEIDTTTGVVRDVNEEDYFPGGLPPSSPNFRITFTPYGDLLASMFDPYVLPLSLYWIDTATGEYRTTGVSLEPISLLAIEHMDDERIPFAPGRRRPSGPPRWPDNLFLVECLPCPPCFGPAKMCDPRVNEDWDRAFINDPRSEIAISFSRAALGMTAKDGFFKAGAPVGDAETELFVVTAPLANAKREDSGAVIFFNAAGKVIARIDGETDAELLGQDMDVRGDLVAVVSTQRLLRFRGSKLVAQMPLDKALFAQRQIHVAFSDDIDGDGQPEILLGGPEATVKGLPFAGLLQVVGSKSGEVISARAGTQAGQRLGDALEWEQPVK
ncbi:hypothetical protein [Marimonas arenosa]|uniref:FG-GAP repeat protein n=1 Tax=Marimonas arenosa TaxID=1795305 RepID=A0AAE4B3G5_9RHOB|nr:hypothetical protein [Marimonas arenosa]MDQ2089210.1 hypothetical protein [Marimonas arenosa]